MHVRGLEGLALLLLFDSLAVVLGLNAGQAVLEVILMVHLALNVLLVDLNVCLPRHHLVCLLLVRPLLVHCLHDVRPLLHVPYMGQTKCL